MVISKTSQKVSENADSGNSYMNVEYKLIVFMMLMLH